LDGDEIGRHDAASGVGRVAEQLTDFLRLLRFHQLQHFLPLFWFQHSHDVGAFVGWQGFQHVGEAFGFGRADKMLLCRFIGFVQNFRCRLHIQQAKDLLLFAVVQKAQSQRNIGGMKLLQKLP
jgi:hypothetical protein